MLTINQLSATQAYVVLGNLVELLTFPFDTIG